MRLSVSILLLLPLTLIGQNRVNGWKSHVSFTPIIAVTETPTAIVGATANGLLQVDKTDFHLSWKTKVEGLSDVGISAITYSKENNYVIVGYESGNLDLIQNGTVLNIPDLTRKAGLPNKSIRRIICEDNFAYLCCAFGIVKVDLQRVEVSETWYLGPNNDPKELFDLTSFNGSWWAATNHGLYKADKQGANLQDYRNWQLLTSPPQPDAAFSSFAQAGGLLLVHDAGNDRIIAFDGSNWQQQYPEIKNIRRIRSAPSGTIVLTTTDVRILSKSGNTLINSYPPLNIASAINPRDALIASNGELWIGDSHVGLLRRSGPTSFLRYDPDSPGSDQISALKSSSETIFAATVTDNQEASYSILNSGMWQNFTASDDPGLKSVAPITSFAIDPARPDEYWISTAGSGLLFFQKNRAVAHYDEQNSALGAQNGKCIVNSLALDSRNNLFYTNPTGKVRLGTRSATGTFTALPYPGMEFSGSPTGDIITTESGINWVVLPDEGLFAFNIRGGTENISDDQYRKITVKSRFSNGTTTLITSFNDISAIAEDLNHQLWVGTGAGVVVYNNPGKVFDPGEFYGTQPSLDDGEGLFKPILEKEKITSIAIDGGNRKWFGTANAGVFLFTEQGDHLLKHFDSKNSPLFSDHINAISIVPKSGELFFATDRGLLSYLSDATAGGENFDKAYVWPNPLRESFQGGVTIDGLTDGTDVKIADLGGNLVYRTISAGGRAVWNAKNASGNRVSTGVYLIFCHSSGSGISKILKLLVIH